MARWIKMPLGMEVGLGSGDLSTNGKLHGLSIGTKIGDLE